MDTLDPLPEQTDTHDWKKCLPSTSLMGGKQICQKAIGSFVLLTGMVARTAAMCHIECRYGKWTDMYELHPNLSITQTVIPANHSAKLLSPIRYSMAKQDLEKRVRVMQGTDITIQEPPFILGHYYYALLLEPEWPINVRLHLLICHSYSKRHVTRKIRLNLHYLCNVVTIFLYWTVPIIGADPRFSALGHQSTILLCFP